MRVDPLSSLSFICMQSGPQEVLEFNPWPFADSGSRQQRQKSALPFAKGLHVIQQIKPMDSLALSNSASLPCPGRNNWSLKTQTQMENECHLCMGSSLIQNAFKLIGKKIKTQYDLIIRVGSVQESVAQEYISFFHLF